MNILNTYTIPVKKARPVKAGRDNPATNHLLLFNIMLTMCMMLFIILPT